MTHPPVSYDDEIDLREIFNVLIKRKKIIIAVFLLFVVGSVVLSFFSSKTYEATASLMITPSRLYDVLSTTGVSLDVDRKETGEYLTQRPTISMTTHQTLLKSSDILIRVIARTGLTDEAGDPIGPISLQDKLSVEEVKGTNILVLKAQDKDPMRARDIVNMWADEYIVYAQDLIAGEVQGAGQFINDQFTIAQQNLAQAEADVMTFKNTYLLDLMSAELEIKKSQLNEYKKQLIGLDVEIREKMDRLNNLKEQIKTQQQFIVVSKAISDDALWQREGVRGGSEAIQDKRLQTEVINPVYQEFEISIARAYVELNTLKQKAEHLLEAKQKLEKEIDQLGPEINKKTLEITRLNRQVDMFKKTYDKLVLKIEDVRIAKAAQLGEARIASFAYEPKTPSGPGKTRMMAIASFLGLMLGVFAAFVVDFWQKGGKSKA